MTATSVRVVYVLKANMTFVALGKREFWNTIRRMLRTTCQESCEVVEDQSFKSARVFALGHSLCFWSVNKSNFLSRGQRAAELRPARTHMHTHTHIQWLRNYCQPSDAHVRFKQVVIGAEAAIMVHDVICGMAATNSIGG